MSERMKAALADAERYIDAVFGHAYGRKNPHLVEEMLDAWAVTELAAAVEKLAEAVRGAR